MLRMTCGRGQTLSGMGPDAGPSSQALAELNIITTHVSIRSTSMICLLSGRQGQTLGGAGPDAGTSACSGYQR